MWIRSENLYVRASGLSVIRINPKQDFLEVALNIGATDVFVKFKTSGAAEMFVDKLTSYTSEPKMHKKCPSCAERHSWKRSVIDLVELAKECHEQFGEVWELTQD